MGEVTERLSDCTGLLGLPLYHPLSNRSGTLVKSTLWLPHVKWTLWLPHACRVNHHISKTPWPPPHPSALERKPTPNETPPPPANQQVNECPDLFFSGRYRCSAGNV